MKEIMDAADEVKNSLNNSCYVLVIQKILEILKDNIEFNFDLLYDLAISQNIDDVFDDLEKMDIRVIDEILNVYDLQLKYFCPNKTHCDDIKNELLKMYEEPVYLSILLYKEHYYLLGKWNNNFFLYDPVQNYPIRCYYRDIIEFISEENVKFFWVQDFDYTYRLSDWLGVHESVKGGVQKRRRLDSSDDDESSDKDQPKKRPRIQESKSQSESQIPKKRKRTNMKGWTEEQKKLHRKKLQKIRNEKRKKKKSERKYVNRKEMTSEERKKHVKKIQDDHNKRTNPIHNDINNAKKIVKPEDRKYRDLSGLSLENKKIEEEHQNEIITISDSDDKERTNTPSDFDFHIS